MRAVFLFSFLFLSVFSLSAEEKNIRIGIIDWRAAIFSSEHAQQENAKIKKTYQKDTDRLKLLESRIKNNQEKLNGNRELMSSTDREKLLNEIQKDVIEYQKLGQRLQQSVQQKEQEFIRSQTVKVQEALEKISKSKGLEVVLNKEAVFYSESTVDITQDLINYLNSKK